MLSGNSRKYSMVQKGGNLMVLPVAATESENVHIFDRRMPSRKAKPLRSPTALRARAKLPCHSFSVGITHLWLQHATSVPIAAAFRLNESSASQIACQPTLCLQRVCLCISQLAIELFICIKWPWLLPGSRREEDKLSRSASLLVTCGIMFS